MATATNNRRSKKRQPKNQKVEAQTPKADLLTFRIMPLKAYLMANYPHWESSTINDVYVEGQNVMRRNQGGRDTLLFTFLDWVTISEHVHIDLPCGRNISGTFIGTLKAISQLRAIADKIDKLDDLVAEASDVATKLFDDEAEKAEQDAPDPSTERERTIEDEIEETMANA